MLSQQQNECKNAITTFCICSTLDRALQGKHSTVVLTLAYEIRGNHAWARHSLLV